MKKKSLKLINILNIKDSKLCAEVKKIDPDYWGLIKSLLLKRVDINKYTPDEQDKNKKADET